MSYGLPWFGTWAQITLYYSWDWFRISSYHCFEYWAQVMIFHDFKSLLLKELETSEFSFFIWHEFVAFDIFLCHHLFFTKISAYFCHYLFAFIIKFSQPASFLSCFCFCTSIASKILLKNWHWVVKIKKKNDYHIKFNLLIHANVLALYAYYCYFKFSNLFYYKKKKLIL